MTTAENTEIITEEAADRNNEYKTLSTPNFIELMYEVEKHLQNGWALSKEDNSYPFFNFFLYEVHLVKNAATLYAAKERLEAAMEGRDVQTKEKRRENMAKARAAVGKNKNKETEGEDSVQ